MTTPRLGGVQIVQRFVLPRLHNQRFLLVHRAFHKAIYDCVADLNAKIIRKLGVSFPRKIILPKTISELPSN